MTCPSKARRIATRGIVLQASHATRAVAENRDVPVQIVRIRRNSHSPRNVRLLKSGRRSSSSCSSSPSGAAPCLDTSGLSLISTKIGRRLPMAARLHPAVEPASPSQPNRSRRKFVRRERLCSTEAGQSSGNSAIARLRIFQPPATPTAWQRTPVRDSHQQRMPQATASITSSAGYVFDTAIS